MDERDNLNLTQKVLGLDISSKTGWSVQFVSKDGCKLDSFGLLGPFEEPNRQYPLSTYEWAHICACSIIEKIDEVKPDVIIIEETSKGSKNHLSQKLLEWIHYIVAESLIQSDVWPIYYQTGEWRGAVGCQMTKEEKKKNALVRKLKNGDSKVVAKDENGKRIGKTTKKHVNVRIANELYGLKLKMKDNDKADALLLVRCYFEYKYNNYTRNLK